MGKLDVKTSNYESGTTFSAVDLTIIAQHEGGNLATAYWPGGNSGVTIGIGIDLGQQSAAGLAAMGVPDTIIEQLSPYLGLHGISAQNYLRLHPLSLSSSDLDRLNACVTTAYFNNVGAQFNHANHSGFANFSALPWQAQTVIADLAYNLGNLPTAAPHFWSQVTNGQWTAAAGNLSNFTDPSNTALYQRAQADGKLLQQAIQSGALPNR
jgi:hypothetical protein